MAKQPEAAPEKKGTLKKLIDRNKDESERGAQEEVLQDLFYDMYKQRQRIYKVNFVRGVFFGVGSVIGGTLVVAVIVWVISLFVDLPVIGEYFQNVQHTIEQTKSQ